MEQFMNEWFFWLWLCFSVIFYVSMFWYDYSAKRPVQDAGYGFGLLFVSGIYGMFWPFTVPLTIIILLCYLPRFLAKSLKTVGSLW